VVGISHGKIAPVKVSLAFKAFRELGPRKLGLFALYRLGLQTGYFRWKTDDWRGKTEEVHPPSHIFHPLLDLPDPDVILDVIGPEGLSQLKTEADEIVEGRVRLFGGESVPLNLSPPGELTHWTKYTYAEITDIKYIWEPARFGWAFALGRAYYVTKDERYPEAFWRYFEIFQQANPVNQGPNWDSAQEVALRLIAFTFAAQIFAPSEDSTTLRTSHLAQAIASHATRIPPTLIYARAQNNNHLLSETAGLITAALALPEHPQAKRWYKLGWKWFTRGLESQIDDHGTYMQQSTNYHRLMLQLGLWVYGVLSPKCEVPRTLHPALAIATRWLFNLFDAESGRVPNLGPNDGAYILPLTVLPFADYRPLLQAAARTFLSEIPFGSGAWDEMSLWLAYKQLSINGNQSSSVSTYRLPITDYSHQASFTTLRTPQSWAYLRAIKFHDRPGHADQLHLDLWWRGLNVAQDAGTYLYNADSPWDNALTHTAVHNTVMIDDRQQMTPAGRFLYLDKAQGKVLKREQAEDGTWERIIASHDGYQRFDMMHVRTVTAHQDDRWIIEDRVQHLADDVQRATHIVRLHWLLPDWEWECDDSGLKIAVLSPYGWISLAVSQQQSADSDWLTIASVQVVRAGKLLAGDGEISPTWGWVSPTYGVKSPALSFSVTAAAKFPITLSSEWRFPNG
jgi:hypothetical protein